MELRNCFIIHPSNPHSLSAKLWPQLPFVSKSKKICIGPFSSWREQVFGNVSSNTILFRQVFKSKCQTRSTKISIESATTPREVAFCTDRELNLCLPFQTLKTFPREELLGKVVMVRFDSKLCPRDDRFDFEYTNKNAINTLKYLCNAGAKVVIVTHWVMPRNSEVLPTQIVADYLSVCLGKKITATEGVIGDKVEYSIDKLKIGDILFLGNLSHYKEEVANGMDFARNLSARIDILVNDAFSDSHRVLASTVGVARFTSARIAGFHLADIMSLLTETLEKPKRPLVAIVGGAKILEKTYAIRSLLCKCDKVVFIGTMSFTFLSALGMSISPHFVEKNARQRALELLDIAKQRNVRVLLPKDFWCINEAHAYEHIQVFEAQCIKDGWRPVEIGPKSLNGIASVLKECKTTLWIGPVKLWPSKHQYHKSLHFTRFLSQFNASGCTSIAIGKEAYNLLKEASCSCSVHPIFKHGAAVWEFLKGNTLAGVAALDRCPNPDFVHHEHRWRMVQRSLVEAIIELICKEGKEYIHGECWRPFCGQVPTLEGHYEYCSIGNNNHRFMYIKFGGMATN